MEQERGTNECVIMKKNSKIEKLTIAYAKSKQKSKILAKKANKSKKLKAIVEQLRKSHKASIIKLRVEKESQQDELTSSHRASMRELKVAYDTQVQELRSDHATRVQDLKVHYSKRELLMVTKMKSKCQEQAGVINCKNDSIKELTRLHEKKICNMDDWITEVIEEKESAISL